MKNQLRVERKAKRNKMLAKIRRKVSIRKSNRSFMKFLEANGGSITYVWQGNPTLPAMFQPTKEVANANQ